MKTAETKKLREIFNAEILKYSDSIFNQMLRYYDSDCYVVLTDEILNFLNENFESFGFVENYSSAIGETVYVSFYGDSILPLDNFKNQLKKMISENVTYNSDLTFYTLYDIEETLRSVSSNKGFIGIIDSYSHIEYETFDELFIYSVLKMKNNK